MKVVPLNQLQLISGGTGKNAPIVPSYQQAEKEGEKVGKVVGKLIIAASIIAAFL